MARFFFALLLLLTALLQATFLPALGFIDMGPDFALLLLLLWSASSGIAEGMIWAFGLGLWLDLLSMQPLGTHAIPLLIVAIIGGLVGTHLLRSGFLLPMATVFGVTIAYDVTSLIVALFAGKTIDAPGAVRLMLSSSLLNVLVVPFGYVALLVIGRWVPRHV